MDAMIDAKYSGCLQKIEKKAKKKGALLTFEGISYTGLLIVLVTLGIAGLGLFETYRIVSCRWELRELSSACISYKTLNVSNQLPSSLGDLVKDASLSANDSNDGVPHGNFIRRTQRWTDAAVNNPWNKPYQIDTAAGTISCETDGIVGTMSTEIGESDK